MDLTWNAFVAEGGVRDVPLQVRWLTYVNAVRDLMDKVGAAKGMSDSQTRVVFAELFAAQVLGDAWVDEHLRSDEGATPEDHALFRYRLWRLGRLLFDLQSFDFYGDFVTNVKQRDLLGALFEAEVVRLLMQLPTRTVLRMPSGKKGLDYDIEFGGSDLNVAVEVKAKSEATPFTAKTVRYTLDDARGQLPKDGLGLIFLRVPYGWTTDQAYQTEIDGVVRALLRNTSRVQAVVLVWDVVANRSETTLRFEVRQRIFRRVHIDHGVEQMLTFLEEVWASEWDGLGPASAF